MTFADAMQRYVENRLITGAEVAQLFAGTGVACVERLEPTQIVEAGLLPCIPIAAARLSAVVNDQLTVGDAIHAALNVMDLAGDSRILDLPLAPEVRKGAVGMGLLADLAAGMIRQRMLPPLAPITPQKITIEELHAAATRGMKDAAERSDARRDRPALRGDSLPVERGRAAEADGGGGQ